MFLPLLILVFALLGVHAGAAGVPTVSCGEVIYADVRLENDLVNCPGYGLVVGADDVTVNLNGHMISSSGESIGAVGVFAALHTGVTVKNGSIRGFSDGVSVGERSRLSGMLIRDAELGVVVVVGSGSVIESNVFRNTTVIAVSSQGSGVTVRGNAFFGAGTAIVVASRSNVVSNLIVGARSGISTQGGDQGDNLIAFNTVSRSEWYGMSIAGDDNRVIGNTVTASGIDAILIVGGKAARTLVRQNIVSGSGDDGIDTDETDTTLERNVAVGNGDLGIEADASAIDGGGNIAFGNGNPLQCTRVICTAAHRK